jgi:hypothetical protein
MMIVGCLNAMIEGKRRHLPEITPNSGMVKRSEKNWQQKSVIEKESNESPSQNPSIDFIA